MKGETVDDAFNGYCELINSENKTLTCGQFRGNKFTDIVIVSDEQKMYEGEVIRNYESNISIGKLSRNSKKVKKVFMEEIHN